MLLVDAGVASETGPRSVAKSHSVKGVCSVDVHGPIDFQAALDNAFGDLRRVGLSGYVDQCLGSVDTDIADGAPEHAFVAFVRQPERTDGPGHAHIRWPDPMWNQPYRLASVLVHEATHVFEYWNDQASWGDERGPVAAERTALCSLLTLASVDRFTPTPNASPAALAAAPA